MAQVQRRIKAEPYRHNAALYFQDNYSVYGEMSQSNLSYVDFYTWLEQEWGCKTVVDYDEKRREYLVFEDDKKASLFVLRFG